MKTLALGAAIAVVALFGNAIAQETNGPTLLSNAQMESITAGVGANNIASQPWPALLAAGFTLNHNFSSDAAQGHAPFEGVAVPSAVPNSVCFAFCGP